MKKLLTLLLAVMISHGMRAQDNTFSLKKAIEYALVNQHSVKNALLDEEIARKKVNELVGIGTPQIEASAELNDFLKIPVSFVPGEFFG
ncbi:MAG: TolC family protein, partial [Bacteroidia bacterium]|nr:TolC family protein [Bacteroidia bacterium]